MARIPTPRGPGRADRKPGLGWAAGKPEKSGGPAWPCASGRPGARHPGLTDRAGDSSAVWRTTTSGKCGEPCGPSRDMSPGWVTPVTPRRSREWRGRSGCRSDVLRARIGRRTFWCRMTSRFCTRERLKPSSTCCWKCCARPFLNGRGLGCTCSDWRVSFTDYDVAQLCCGVIPDMTSRTSTFCSKHRRSPPQDRILIMYRPHSHQRQSPANKCRCYLEP